MLGSVILGPYAFGMVQVFFLGICLLEYQNMFAKSGMSTGRLSFIIWGVLSYFMILLFLWWGIEYLLLILLFIFTIIINGLFDENQQPIMNIGITILGLIYLVLPFSLLNFFFYPELNYGFPSNRLLLGFFIVIWGNDTFAYLSGMAFGKHKLFERISPKKTWEGTMGGALFGVIVGIVFSLFFKDLNALEWIGYALTIIIFGTFGDLFESLMKRTLGLKDSGNIMPGHGGILDRFDSILMAAPFAYIYIVFVLN
jgi:phosphatidate cytidylyltransferase